VTGKLRWRGVKFRRRYLLSRHPLEGCIGAPYTERAEWHHRRSPLIDPQSFTIASWRLVQSHTQTTLAMGVMFMTFVPPYSLLQVSYSLIETDGDNGMRAHANQPAHGLGGYWNIGCAPYEERPAASAAPTRRWPVRATSDARTADQTASSVCPVLSAAVSSSVATRNDAPPPACAASPSTASRNTWHAMSHIGRCWSDQQVRSLARSRLHHEAASCYAGNRRVRHAGVGTV
jgi:hypothetical protein